MVGISRGRPATDIAPEPGLTAVDVPLSPRERSRGGKLMFIAALAPNLGGTMKRLHPWKSGGIAVLAALCCSRFAGAQPITLPFQKHAIAVSTGCGGVVTNEPNPIPTDAAGKFPLIQRSCQGSTVSVTNIVLTGFPAQVSGTERAFDGVDYLDLTSQMSPMIEMSGTITNFDPSGRTVVFISHPNPTGATCPTVAADADANGNFTVKLTSCQLKDAFLNCGTQTGLCSSASSVASTHFSLGGQGTVRGSTTYFNFGLDLASEYGSSPSSNSIAVDHIEVVQAVQSADNTAAPLVAGKNTVVRVFPKSTGTNSVAGVACTLTVNGGTYQNPMNGASLTASPPPVDRSAIQSSCNFRIDPPPEGALRLSARLTAPSKDTATQDLVVQVLNEPPPRDFQIVSMEICLAPPNGNPQCPDHNFFGGATYLRFYVFPMFPYPESTLQIMAV